MQLTWQCHSFAPKEHYNRILHNSALQQVQYLSSEGGTPTNGFPPTTYLCGRLSQIQIPSTTGLHITDQLDIFKMYLSSYVEIFLTNVHPCQRWLTNWLKRSSLNTNLFKEIKKLTLVIRFQFSSSLKIDLLNDNKKRVFISIV